MIGEDAFDDCRNLVEVINLSSLDIKVGSRANGYVACYAQKVLTNEDEKGEVFNVGDYSFYKQGGEYILYRYTGSDRNLILPGFVDGGHSYKIGKGVFKGKYVVSVVMPESVIAIDYEAFSGCSNLTSVVIGENVSTIGSYAFSNCSSLTSVVIGENVTSIGNSAFSNCSSLTSIIIPEKVTAISGGAFYDCSKLTSVEFKNPEGWKRDGTAISADDLKNSETAATYLTSSYYWYTWTREDKGE